MHNLGLARPKKLTIRLRALELEMLREVARSRGSPTATFARAILLDAVRQNRAPLLQPAFEKSDRVSANVDP